jgi:hypothetical protein
MSKYGLCRVSMDTTRHDSAESYEKNNTRYIYYKQKEYQNDKQV